MRQLSRVAATSTILLAALTLSALPADASTPHTNPTSITLTKSKASVSPGTRVVLTARFAANNHSRVYTPVNLNIRDANNHVSNVHLRTGSTGIAAIAVYPRASSRYTWSIGSTSTASAASKLTIVLVSSYQVHMAATATPNPVTAGSAVQLHDVLTANGRPYAGALVNLYANGHLAGQNRTDSHGAVNFTTHPTVATSYVLASPQYLPYRYSGVRINVGVRYQPDYTVTATPAQINAGDTSTIHATVTANNNPVRGILVTLNASGSSTHPTATTDSNGQTIFTVTPDATTDYSVSTPAFNNVLAGTSTPTTVTVTPAPPLTFPSTVDVTANPTTIQAGNSSTITATITSTGGPRVGALAVLTDGNGNQIDTATTNNSGQASFTVSPTSTTTYTVAVAAALPILAGSGQATVTVTPAPPTNQPSTVDVTATPASILLGDTSTLSATVTSNGTPRAGTTATLTDGNGTVIDTATTDNSGQASFTVNPLLTTTYTVAVPAAGQAQAGSGQATVTVNLLSPVDNILLNAAPATITNGDSTTLTGRVTTLLPGLEANAPVTLSANGVPVDTGTTDADGVVRFTVSPTSTTTYTLTADGLSTTLGISGAATVTVLPSPGV